jgi:hypothetical protein
MPQLVHERPILVTGSDGALYDRARIRAAFQPGGIWEAWIEFVGIGGKRVLRTDIETTQPDLAAVDYWASGLEPIYFEGALARAERRRQALARDAVSRGGAGRDRRLAGKRATPSSRRSRFE